MLFTNANQCLQMPVSVCSSEKTLVIVLHMYVDKKEVFYYTSVDNENTF